MRTRLAKDYGLSVQVGCLLFHVLAPTSDWQAGAWALFSAWGQANPGNDPSAQPHFRVATSQECWRFHIKSSNLKLFFLFLCSSQSNLEKPAGNNLLTNGKWPRDMRYVFKKYLRSQLCSVAKFCWRYHSERAVTLSSSEGGHYIYIYIYSLMELFYFFYGLIISYMHIMCFAQIQAPLLCLPYSSSHFSLQFPVI